MELKIDQIQDNIVSAQFNVVHPSIFWTQEIEKFKIDVYKLRMLKVEIMTLVTEVQISYGYVKLFMPIPGKNNLEIVSGLNRAYHENDCLRKLKMSKHCIFHNSHNLIFNNV